MKYLFYILITTFLIPITTYATEYIDLLDKEQIISENTIQELSCDDKLIKCTLNDPVVEFYYNSNQEVFSDYIRINDEIIFEDIDKRQPDKRFFTANDKQYVKIYSSNNVIKVNNSWFSVERATSSIIKYEEKMQIDVPLPLSFIYPVLADSVYSSNDDSMYNTNANWSTVRSSTSGTGLIGNPTLIFARLYSAGGTYGIGRALLNFDTSSIPDDATLSEVKLYVYGDSKNGAQNFSYNVFGSTASNPIANEDFDLVDSNYYSDDPITQSEFSTTGYNEWTFNATGTSAISKTGLTKLSIREQTKDAFNVTPTVDENILIRTKTNAEAGTTKDPYILIEYELPTTTSSTITTYLDNDFLLNYYLNIFYIFLSFLILSIVVIWARQLL